MEFSSDFYFIKKSLEYIVRTKYSKKLLTKNRMPHIVFKISRVMTTRTKITNHMYVQNNKIKTNTEIKKIVARRGEARLD